MCLIPPRSGHHSQRVQNTHSEHGKWKHHPAGQLLKTSPRGHDLYPEEYKGNEKLHYMAGWIIWLRI